ncbi:hypothetical protein LPJ72_000699 [Coemansia sp. Benny D160-2]|nr:hypothetical protein LPJ72_000699 [Coemansia sp. Benny D160-2]
MSAEEKIVSVQTIDAEFRDKLQMDEAPSPDTKTPARSGPQTLDVLRNNEEYMLIHHTIESLKSQLARAKSDMDILYRLRDDALAHPVEYVESLLAGTSPKAPPQQSVVNVPYVYVDPYFSYADPSAVQRYQRHMKSAGYLNRQLFASNDAVNGKISTDNNQHGSVRHVSASGHSTPTKARYAAKRGSRQPASASTVLLTGVTAVATPERFSQRQLPQQLSQASALGLANMGYSETQSLKHTAGLKEGTYLAPPMDRANTEPVHRSSVTLSEPEFSRAGSKDSAADSFPVKGSNSLSGTRIGLSATQPGTPNERAGSQKTLTPQMLEEFRRQVSEERSRPPSRHSRHAPSTTSTHNASNGLENGEDSGVDEDDDDDEYYNKLVQAATAAGPDNNVQPAYDTSDPLLITSVAAPAVTSAAGQRGAGKSLHLGSQYLQHLQKLQNKAQGMPFVREPQTKTPKRGVGRPKKNALATSAPKRIRKSKTGHRGPTRRDSNRPKPVSFNLPWSDEEQQQLEELLLAYPEEEVANDRWRKIAEALGTRTMRQVASRVQKYFIKLSKAGLPVPGRVPDTTNWTSIGGGRLSSDEARRKKPGGGTGSASGSRKRKKYVDFTSSSEDGGDEVEIELAAASDDERHGHVSLTAEAAFHDHKGKQADRSNGFSYFENNADGGTSSFRLAVHEGGSSSNTSGIREPMYSADEGSTLASSSTSANPQTAALRSAKAVHLGYRCDACMAEPIVGIRWTCLECRGAHAVDLCDECREEGTFETDWHRTTHSFHAVRDAEMEPYYANEVASAALREYSYLA